MDTFLEKYLNGEITKEQYEAEVAKLTPEEKAKHNEKMLTPEVRAQMSAAATKELEKVEGLRRERQRLEKDPPKPDTDYATTLRKENVEKAAQKLFSKFSIPTEDQQHYRDVFRNNDSGHVDTDLIYTDFQNIYAGEHSSELLDIAARFADMEQGADEFNADNGGAPGGAGAGGSDNEEKVSPAVMEYVKEAAKKGVKLTAKDAKKVLDRGATTPRIF